MTTVNHNPFLESLKKALHREASEVGFLAIEDVDRVFASTFCAQPVAWYWEDATGCFHITLDRPDVAEMANAVGCTPKPLFAGSDDCSRFFNQPAPSVAVKASKGALDKVAGMHSQLHVVTAALSVTPAIEVQDVCPICIKAFRLGDILCPRPNGPGPVHAECLNSNPDVDQETGEIIRDTLPTFIYEGHRLLVTTQGDAPETCPICQEAFKLSDLCATDITMGTCHAECLDDSPVVDLDTGHETGGTFDLYHYIVDAPPAPLPQSILATHRHKLRGSSYQLIGAATIQTAGKLADMDAVVIYRNEDGTLWARSPSEFFDGRFEEVGPQQASSGDP